MSRGGPHEAELRGRCRNILPILNEALCMAKAKLSTSDLKGQTRDKKKARCR